jgi:hypothetical protein
VFRAFEEILATMIPKGLRECPQPWENQASIQGQTPLSDRSILQLIQRAKSKVSNVAGMNVGTNNVPPPTIYKSTEMNAETSPPPIELPKDRTDKLREENLSKVLV